MADDRAAALQRDLRAAAELRSMSFVRQFDRNYVKDKGRIIYAIDSAILSFLFGLARPTESDQPQEGEDRHESNWRRRRKKSRSVEYDRDPYQVFFGPLAEPGQEGDLQTRQARLGPVLLWHLLKGAADEDGSDPFLLLPGHDYEARRLYDRIVGRMTLQQQRMAGLNECAAELKQLVTSAQERGHSAESVRSAFTKTLYGLLYDISEPHEKFARFNQLLQERRVMRLGSALADPHFTDDRLGKGKSHVFNAADVREQFVAQGKASPGTISWWSNQLHGRLPSAFLENDRMALSTLDRMNRALDPANVRIVLVTANTLISEAGTLYRPFDGKRSDIYAQMSFSDLYLRHPKSLLLDAEFLRPTVPESAKIDDSTGSDIDGWLDALLADADDEALSDFLTNGADASLTESAEKLLEFRGSAALSPGTSDRLSRLEQTLKRKPTLHKDLVARWADYIERLIEGHSTLSLSAEDAIRETFGEHELNSEGGIDDFLDRIRGIVRRLSEESWNTFFRTAADTGLELIDIATGAQQEIVWPVPSLYFQTSGGLQDIMRNLWSPEKLRNQPVAVLDMIAALRDKPDVKSAYVHTLCYGLMFAFAGRWSLTRLLAQRAIQISRIVETTARNGASEAWTTGREAYYLLAVASRIVSRNEADLADARHALELATNARSDPAEDRNPTGAPLTGIRFRAEEFAIEVARIGLAKGPRGPFFDGLQKAFRGRILNELATSGKCKEPHIELKARVALRSEYFGSLVPRVSDLDTPAFAISVPSDERRKAGELLTEQTAEIEKLYAEHDWIPIRDRKLLHFAALQLGRESQLPAWVWGRSGDASEMYRIAHGSQFWDRLGLARLNKAIDRLGGSVARLAI